MNIRFTKYHQIIFALNKGDGSSVQKNNSTTKKSVYNFAQVHAIVIKYA